MIPAGKWGRVEKVEKLELTAEEAGMQETARSIWGSILNSSTVDDQTDFFKSGAGSMDVTRCACVCVFLPPPFLPSSLPPSVPSLMSAGSHNLT